MEVKKEIQKSDAELKLEMARHSAAHVLAMAVQKIWPEAKLAIGPAIDNGFYYDFDIPEPISEELLVKIEKEMRGFLHRKLPFSREELTIDAAKKLFADRGEPYKVELVDDLAKNGETAVSIYRTGDWLDLCRGPHVADTGAINPDGLKLDRVSGAYWRGDEKNKMLQRVYALYFDTKASLDEFVNVREEAKKRDHRLIGKEMDLFSTHEEAGQGLVYWHPKGGRIRTAVEDFWRAEHFKNGYEILFTPHIGRSWLWETSGHLSFYKENMYAPMTIDDEDYYVKPMNCPFHIMVYKSRMHSYRELPFRWAEFGTVYRYEMSGVLHGLLRVRGFTQDDAHIFCTQEQIGDEIAEVLRFSLNIWKTFGFKDIKAYLATRPAKSVGEESLWQKAADSLKKAIEAQGLSYEIDEGGGAFYGPKIDLKVRDAIGREWQVTTIQFDFNMPERFDMTYTDSDGKEKRPFMVHRALLGSLERFFGVLIEHYAGKFPTWLAPVQIEFIPVSENQIEQTKAVMSRFREEGLRVEGNFSDDTLSKKIFQGRSHRVPYMAIIGEREVAEGKVTVRNRDTQKQTAYDAAELITLLVRENQTRALELGL